MALLSKYLKLLPLALLYFLLSCHNKKDTVFPAGIVQPDTMASILADAHVIQAAAQLGYSPDATDTSIDEAYLHMWEKHHLTEEEYNNNMKFYCNHPQLLDSVYEKVLNNLSQQKVELMGKRALPGK